MTTNLSPAEVKQGVDAFDLGKDLGYRWRFVREDLLLPRGEWKALVEVLQVNPWAPGEYPPGECDPGQAERLAKRFQQGFEVGDHAAQADIRRGIANRGQQ